jgi:F-type H+-transporting ATPase subunit epsilon
MSPVRVDIVTAERVVYSEEVDIVVAPGSLGQLGILPHHAPLMTTLQAGELLTRKDGEEYSLAISGGFLEVRPDRVIVLADSAERADEIDLARAETAKERARQRLIHPTVDMDMARAESSLQRALTRIKVVEKRRRRSRTL